MISKEQFLELTDGGFEYYKHHLPELELMSDGKCKNVLNPFYDDTQPGLNIFFDEVTERWKFKDYGCPDNGKEYSGDVFDFAAFHHGLLARYDFPELLVKMSEEIGMKQTKEPSKLPKTRNKKKKTLTITEIEQLHWEFQNDIHNDSVEDYSIRLKGFEICYRGEENGIELSYEYFKKYGITRQILKEYYVHAVHSYKTVDADNNIIKKTIPSSVLAMAYESSCFSKIYSPDGSFKFWYIGQKPSEYIFGEKKYIEEWRKEIRQEIFLLLPEAKRMC